MGKTIVYVFIALFFLFTFSACKKERDKCENNSRAKEYWRPADQKDWFDSCINLSKINCISSIGVSEEYVIWDHEQKESIHFDSDSCIYHTVTERYMDFISNLYKYHFDLRFHYPYPSKLPVLEGIVSQGTEGHNFFLRQFEPPFNDLANVSYIPDSTKGCCGFLSSFTTQTGDNYTNVYFFKSKSNSTKVATFCISQYYGILEFKSDKGITWTFDYK